LIGGASVLSSLSVWVWHFGSREGQVGKRVEVTCEDCFFHKKNLCALVLASPCPTFRAGTLEPPRQPRLVPRPVSAFAREVAAA
jgi:hypothetical protein